MHCILTCIQSTINKGVVIQITNLQQTVIQRVGGDGCGGTWECGEWWGLGVMGRVMSRAIFQTLKISKIRPYSLDFLNLKNKKLDQKTCFLDFLDLKNDCSSSYISKICLKSPFLVISPQIFLATFFLESPLNFLGTPKIFYPPKIFWPPQIFFTHSDLEILFLDFLALKNFFFQT